MLQIMTTVTHLYITNIYLSLRENYFWYLLAADFEFSTELVSCEQHCRIKNVGGSGYQQGH